MDGKQTKGELGRCQGEEERGRERLRRGSGWKRDERRVREMSRRGGEWEREAGRDDEGGRERKIRQGDRQ